MSKNVVLFGATGSIGNSVLRVLDLAGKNFNLKAITCNKNTLDLIKLSQKYKCNNLGIADENSLQNVDISGLNKNIICGIQNFDEFINEDVDIYILAIAGIISAELALKIAKTGKILAIANKENIISLGKILTSVCKKFNTQLFPLDSEHNAIYQLLDGLDKPFKTITITASGGPFLNTPLDHLKNIKSDQAIKHPKWKMGKKISVDSSNMMNKSLEIIEAKNLFNLKNDEINAIIHPQSIVHGFINFNDNSSYAFLSQPNMEIPISSLFFPKKNFRANNESMDLTKLEKLEFREIDYRRFPAFRLGKSVMIMGGLAPHILNYVNEKLVNLFLDDLLNYLDIINLNEMIMENFFKSHQNIESPEINDISNTSKWIEDNFNNLAKL